jgi:4-hydroxybenzoyl-CoA thioesterase
MTTETENDVFTSVKLVRFAHCDPAGIIFYPHYFVMLNGLVEDWFTHGLGINYAHMISTKRLGGPMLSIKCDFSAPSRLGEHIEFKLKLERIGNSSFTLATRVLMEQELRLSAQLTLCIHSFETGRAVPIPDDIRQQFIAFQKGELGRDPA